MGNCHTSEEPKPKLSASSQEEPVRKLSSKQLQEASGQDLRRTIAVVGESARHANSDIRRSTSNLNRTSSESARLSVKRRGIQEGGKDYEQHVQRMHEIDSRLFILEQERVTLRRELNRVALLKELSAHGFGSPRGLDMKKVKKSLATKQDENRRECAVLHDEAEHVQVTQTIGYWFTDCAHVLGCTLEAGLHACHVTIAQCCQC